VQARIVLIALSEPGADRLRIAAADGEGSDAYGLVGMDLELGGSKTGRVLQRGRSERVDSVLDDPEIDQQVARRMGVRSAVYVPLFVGARAIGVVVAHDKIGSTSSFTDEDVRLAESLATRAATAVELSQRVSRDAVKRVVEAQENERARLARELHDETGQALTSILLGLKSLEDRVETDEGRAAAAELRELVVSTLRDVRRLAVELRPAALDDFGLVPAIERLCDLIGERSDVSVDVRSELGDERLTAEAETVLYRIAQEALTNVLKHADARTVRVSLIRSGSGVTLAVQDDGTGFDPEAVRDGGVGLLGMRERIALLGGRLTIESSDGAGTMLAAEVPIQ
jgi:signal transduction histidine kinase